MSTQKEAAYTSTNTYRTLNNLTEKTKNVWMVFHGMGYLSKYFTHFLRSFLSWSCFFLDKKLFLLKEFFDFSFVGVPVQSWFVILGMKTVVCDSLYSYVCMKNTKMKKKKKKKDLKKRVDKCGRPNLDFVEAIEQTFSSITVQQWGKYIFLDFFSQSQTVTFICHFI